MSLEAALEEERLEVLKILEGRPTPKHDAGNAQMPLGQSSGSNISAPPIRSMLDIGDSSAPGKPSQAVSSGASNTRERKDPFKDYQFDMRPSNQNQALPKRVTQGGKKSLAPVMQGQNLKFLQKSRDGAIYETVPGDGGMKSPSSQAFNRSQPPGMGLTPGFIPSLGAGPDKYMTESGKVIDMSLAHQKLNDAALLSAGGALSNLPSNTAAGRAIAETGEMVLPNGEVRLQKDYYPTGGDGPEVVESSDEGTSGDEPWGQPRIGASRKDQQIKTAEGDISTKKPGSDVPATGGMVGLGKTPDMGRAQSLLAAAEEERKASLQAYQQDLLTSSPGLT